MSILDFRCANGHLQENIRARYGERPTCPECGGVTEIVWLSSFPNVIPDSVPGGFTVENMTREPETFYSRSDHRRRVKELGLRIRDEFAPMPGTDKSKNSVRWV